MPNTRRVLSSLFYAAALGLAASGSAVQAQDSPPSHPFGLSQPIPGRYIVVFKTDVGNPAAEAANLVRAAGPGAQLLHSYTAALKGFAATLPEAALAGLRNNPMVDYIEQDQTVSLELAESPATWGLDRIDERERLLNSTYNYNTTASNVNAYIIDTGIRADHVEFTGRVRSGYTAISDGRGTDDCNGHGTHVSGTVGGTTWGVAKGVSLTPVRVLDCRGSGSWSGVISGIDWVAANAALPAVANMSLGGGKSSSVNSAVAGAVNKGVTMVVAAGNSSADACNYSPASEPSALTVGATTNADARASYSNYGSCVDVFAPGSSITSAWNTSSSATNTISGTSMASPHVTGVAALVASANTTATTTPSPAAISSFVVSNATANLLASVGAGSPNLLLYSLATGAATEPGKTSVAVSSLTGSWVKSGRNWRGKVAATVRDVKGSNPVANATVKGTFEPGGTASCVTDGSGNCTLTSGPIAPDVGASVFSVTDVTGSNLTYSAGTWATQVTITHP